MHTTAKAIKVLSEELNLAGLDQDMQDWDLMVADIDRIDEFIDYYQNNGNHTNVLLDDEVKFALMEIILVSIDDAKNLGKYNSSSWSKVPEILIKEKKLHQSTLEYWTCLGTNITDGFEITGLIRELL